MSLRRKSGVRQYYHLDGAAFRPRQTNAVLRMARSPVIWSGLAIGTVAAYSYDKASDYFAVNTDIGWKTAANGGGAIICFLVANAYAFRAYRRLQGSNRLIDTSGYNNNPQHTESLRRQYVNFSESARRITVIGVSSTIITCAYSASAKVSLAIISATFPSRNDAMDTLYRVDSSVLNKIFVVAGSGFATMATTAACAGAAALFVSNKLAKREWNAATPPTTKVEDKNQAPANAEIRLSQLRIADFSKNTLG